MAMPIKIAYQLLEASSSLAPVEPVTCEENWISVHREERYRLHFKADAGGNRPHETMKYAQQITVKTKKVRRPEWWWSPVYALLR